jgi:hypothetical protein
MFLDLTLDTEQIRPITVQVGLPPVTFDDLYETNGSSSQIPPGYGGLNWSNFNFFNALTALNPSGYKAGMVSPPNVAYNGGGNPASIIGPVPFDLLSAALTAAWNNNLNVDVKGYVGTNMTYERNVILSATAPTTVQFNYYGVNSVSFASSGGTQYSGYTGTGKLFVMDNVTVVPHDTPSVAPLVQQLAKAGGMITFDWAAQMGETYQVQYSTNLSQPSWISWGSPITATNSILTVSDTSTNAQRYYRLLLLP